MVRRLLVCRGPAIRRRELCVARAGRGALITRVRRIVRWIVPSARIVGLHTIHVLPRTEVALRIAAIRHLWGHALRHVWLGWHHSRAVATTVRRVGHLLTLELTGHVGRTAGVGHLSVALSRRLVSVRRNEATTASVGWHETSSHTSSAHITLARL